MLAKILILALFLCVTVAIGVYCRRYADKVSSFVLGGRDVGPWLTAFAYGTSYFSAVVFVGYAGQFGWNFGVSAAWIGIGNAMVGSLLAWVVLGRRTRVMTKHYESATMPDFFAKRYKSPGMRIVTAVIIFVFLVPYSASVYKGLSGLFSMSFNLDYRYCVIGIAIITGAYVILGGYIATAFNDLFQGIIMIGGIIAVIVGVLRVNGGFMASIEALSQIPLETKPGLNGALVSFFGPDIWMLVSVAILTSLGAWGLPQMVHKFYTIKNERAIKAGSIISTVFALIIAGGSYFMGAFGQLFYAPGADGRVVFDDIVPTMLAKSLPDILIGIVLILVLSASMSTLAALVLASSSTFTLDFLNKIVRRGMSDKQQVFVMKILCAVFVVLSVLLALRPGSLITSLMSLSWGTLAGCFLGPFLYGLLWKKTTRAGVYASLLCGILINALNLAFTFTSPIKAGAVSIVWSLVVVPLVSVVTPKLPKEHTDDAFSCYDQPIQARHKYALDEKSE